MTDIKFFDELSFAELFVTSLLGWEIAKSYASKKILVICPQKRYMQGVKHDHQVLPGIPLVPTEAA